MSYRETLASSLKAKQQRLRLILSPPRSGSTLMGASQGRSVDAHYSAASHEPFIELKRGAQDPETGYDNLCKLSDEAPNGATIITKEMSHWLAIADAYQGLMDYVNEPVMVLIRNPLLNIESRMRKVLQTMTLRPKKSVIRTLAGTEVDEEQMQLEFQIPLLNDYARDRGYPNWKTMIELATEHGNYQDFNDFLQIPGVLDLEGFGWEALAEETQFFRERGIPFIVIDSTEHRGDPELMTQKITQAWGITYSEDMVRWDDELRLETTQTEAHQEIWYAKLKKSSGIKEPYERPIRLDQFPEFLHDYIRDVALPIYTSIYRSPERLTPQPDLLDKEIMVRTPQGDMFRPLKYVDPIFAAISAPHLALHDPEIARAIKVNGAFPQPVHREKDFKDV